MLVVNLGSLAPRYAARARLIAYRVQLGRFCSSFPQPPRLRNCLARAARAVGWSYQM